MEYFFLLSNITSDTTIGQLYNYKMHRVLPGEEMEGVPPQPLPPCGQVYISPLTLLYQILSSLQLFPRTATHGMSILENQEM